MKKTFTLIAILFSFFAAKAQLTPEVTSWIINYTGATGYGGIPSNVQQVQYSTNNVYVSCTCIPAYSIGPWTGNPNIPSNQNFVYKITRNPVQNTGTLIATPMGHTGVWTNGVSVFNPKDGFSYNMMNIWHRNAIIAEGISFDNCLGHPAPNGEYHHHLNPTCLYNDQDSSVHAPIIGFAFDGFPVYGAYGFVNTNGTGGITRMHSSYQLRNITTRTTLPDGTVLLPAQYGPAVSVTYPLGLYLEDFEYIVGLGDLDEHNGRFCITPEYPAGIYSYFVTLDSALDAAYPYTFGPEYYGTVQPGNTGPGSGHNVITEPVTVYTSVNEIQNRIDFIVYPNPAVDFIALYVSPGFANNISATLLNSLGQIISTHENIQTAVTYSFDVKKLNAGIYFLRLTTNGFETIKKISVIR